MGTSVVAAPKLVSLEKIAKQRVKKISKLQISHHLTLILPRSGKRDEFGRIMLDKGKKITHNSVTSSMTMSKRQLEICGSHVAGHKRDTH